ncbi:MAG: KEOPS complex subunit Cgi121 [Candidatus Bathyarchaeia archaeon]
MLKEVEEFRKHIAIIGFKNVRVDNVDSFLNKVREELKNVTVQFFDAKFVAGWQHLYFAALNALKAFKNKTNISKNLAVECLLYAAAQRQITAALDLIGIKQKSCNVAVLLMAEEKRDVEKTVEKIAQLIPGQRDDEVLDLLDEKVGYIKRLFDISDAELETKLEENGIKKAISDLVIEHIALLVTQR